MRPVIHPRSSPAGEAQAAHLAACVFCGVDNGITAPVCWQCGAQSWRRAASATAAPLQSTIVRAEAFGTRAIILPTLESEPDDEDFLALAPRPSHDIALEAPPPRPVAQGRSHGQTIRLRTMLATAGGLGVVALLAGLMLFDRYQNNQIGVGWSAAPRHDAAPTASTQTASELIETSPPAAGAAVVPSPVVTLPSAAAPPPPPEPDAPSQPIDTASALRALNVDASRVAPAAIPPVTAPSAPWACTEGVAALGLCELAPAAARP